MENSRKKRHMWRDNEVKEMLSLIKEKHIKKLLDKKTKRNKTIFEDVAQGLVSKGIHKNAEQIRAKFKFMKSEYCKAKRNNNTSAADWQTSQHFHLFDDLMGRHAAVSVEDVDTLQTNSEDASSPKISEPECFVEDISVENEAGLSLPSSSASFRNHNTFKQTSPIISEPENFVEDFSVENEAIRNLKNRGATCNSLRNQTFKQPRKQTYQKVMESFTKEWKQTQENLVNVMKEQDKKYLCNLEKLLEKNREDTKKMLEDDRRETEKMIVSLLNSMQSSAQPNMPNSSPQQFEFFFNNRNSTAESACTTSEQADIFTPAEQSFTVVKTEEAEEFF